MPASSAMSFLVQKKHFSLEPECAAERTSGPEDGLIAVDVWARRRLASDENGRRPGGSRVAALGPSPDGLANGKGEWLLMADLCPRCGRP
jgi:hypothetical protein